MRNLNKEKKNPKVKLDTGFFEHNAISQNDVATSAAALLLRQTADYNVSHLSILRSILFMRIPAPRMSTMNSTVRPRRNTSCLTSRGRGSAASAVSSRPGPSTCRSDFHSSWLRLLDETMSTWDSLRAVIRGGRMGSLVYTVHRHACSRRACNEKRNWSKHLFTPLTIAYNFFFCNLDSCSHHCLFIHNYDSCL